MDHQLELEMRGERSYNRVRIMLIITFSVPIIIGYLTKTIRWEFFLVTMLLYLVSLSISSAVLATGRYRSWIKYLCGTLEICAVYFINISNLFLSLDQWNQAVGQASQFAVYFILIGTAALRFSPQLAFYMGMLSVAVYSAVHLTAMGAREMSLTFGPLGDRWHLLSATNWIIGTVSIMIMSTVIAIACRYVRELVITSRKNEQVSKENLTSLMELIYESTTTVVNISIIVSEVEKIGNENKELSMEHAGSVQKTMTAMEKINETVETVAGNALTQGELCDGNMESMKVISRGIGRIEELSGRGSMKSEATQELARRGEEELAHAVEGIIKINEGSKKIAEIVSVINDIADQTNLLALNAAIEAARAGTEGRGFAVVADEVGKLADLAASHAGEIARMVSTTGQDTEKGVEAILATVTSLKEITAGVRDMGDLMKEVYTLVREQAEKNLSMEKDTARIQEMASSMKNATGDQLTQSREVLRAMEEISRGAERSALLSGNLSESLQKLSATNRQLNSKIQELAGGYTS